MSQTPTLNAGSFATWLAQVQAGQSAEVPCGDCNACCRASYFIQVKASEQAAQKAIPEVLLFRAPAMAEGDRVMGYNEHGACPMLQNNQCQIYSDRPQTCRDYDCRIFAATGIPAGGEEKRDVNTQVARWQFSYADDTDRQQHQQVKQAVTFLNEHKEAFSQPQLPNNPTQLALLAINIAPKFNTQSSSADLIEYIRAVLVR